jgi:hypothetical protein
VLDNKAQPYVFLNLFHDMGKVQSWNALDWLLIISWISVVGGWKNIIFASVNSSSSGFAVLGLSVGFIMKTEPILILLIMLYYIFIYYYIYIKSFNS